MKCKPMMQIMLKNLYHEIVYTCVCVCVCVVCVCVREREREREFISLKEKWKSLSCVSLFVIPWTIQSMEFSRLEYWSG